MRHPLKKELNVLLIISGVIVFLILSCVLLMHGHHQQTVWADSSYLFHPGIGEAVIDGSMGEDEWSTADAHYRQMSSTSSVPLHGILYVMQSAEDLYLAFVVDDDELTTGEKFGLYGDTLKIDFDDNNSGSFYEVDENRVSIFAADPWYMDSYYYNESGSSEADIIGGGTNDGEGAVGRSDYFNQYELRFPLCSGDDKDFCLTPGDILGLRIIYYDVFPIPGDFDYDAYGYPGFLNTSLVTIEIADVSAFSYLPLIMK